MEGYYCCNCDSYETEKFHGGVCGGCGMSTLSDTPIDCFDCEICGDFKPKFRVPGDALDNDLYICEQCNNKK